MKETNLGVAIHGQVCDCKFQIIGNRPLILDGMTLLGDSHTQVTVLIKCAEYNAFCCRAALMQYDGRTTVD